LGAAALRHNLRSIGTRPLMLRNASRLPGSASLSLPSPRWRMV